MRRITTIVAVAVVALALFAAPAFAGDTPTITASGNYFTGTESDNVGVGAVFTDPIGGAFSAVWRGGMQCGYMEGVDCSSRQFSAGGGLRVDVGALRDWTFAVGVGLLAGRAPDADGLVPTPYTEAVMTRWFNPRSGITLTLTGAPDTDLNVTGVSAGFTYAFGGP